MAVQDSGFNIEKPDIQVIDDSGIRGSDWHLANVPVQIPDFDANLPVDPSADVADRALRSRAVMENIVRRDRQQLRSGYSGGSGALGMTGFINSIIKHPSPLASYDVPDSEIYERLNDGRQIPKYRTYKAGVDNEDRLARDQSTFEKIGNGVNKAVMKFGLNVFGNLAEPFYGIYAAAKEGNKAAVWDNDFSAWIDDQNTRMNYMLPNYRTKEEREYNFFQKMTVGAPNFWADELLGNTTFTLAAMTTEGLWALATGGASIGASAARMAGRAAIKGAARAGLRGAGRAAVRAELSAARNVLSGSKAAMNGYLRSMKAANIAGSTLNNARFIGTSAPWESSIEVFQYAKQARADYLESFRAAYGRNPNRQETAEFEERLRGVGNNIFAANIGIVGLSNFLMFGRMFGVGTKLSSTVSRATNRGLFGIGIEQTAEKALKSTAQKGLQKAAKRTWSLLEKPFSEGIWEEGMQGVVSRAGEEYIRSRFDPDATQRNMSALQAIKHGFAETYGTKEGWNEVGIGALIGGLFGAFGGALTANGRAVGDNETLVKNANAASTELEKAYRARLTNRLMIDGVSDGRASILGRLALLNAEHASTERAQDEADKGNWDMAVNHFNQAQFAQMEAYDNADMLDDAAKNFYHIVDNTDINEIKQAYGGMTDGQAGAFREAVKQEYQNKLESYRRAKEFAGLAIGDQSRYSMAKHSLALNVFLSDGALDAMNGIAENIERLTGTGGVANAMNLRSTADRKTTENVGKIDALDKKTAALAEEINTVNQTGRNPRIRAGEDTTPVNERISRMQEELNSLQAERKALADITRQNIDTEFEVSRLRNGGEKATLEQLLAAHEELRKLDGTIAALKENSPYVSTALSNLAYEYRRQLVNLRSYNETVRRMADARFMRNTERGLSRLLRGYSTPYAPDEETEEKLHLSGEPAALPGKRERLFGKREMLSRNDEQLKQSYDEGKITEDEYYTFVSLNHLLERFEKPESENETVTDEEFTASNLVPEGVDPASEKMLADVFDRIAGKNMDDHVPLTPRETDIYGRYREDIDRRQEALKIKRGDSVLTRLSRLRDRNARLQETQDPVARNRILIDDFREDYGYADGIEEYRRLERKNLTDGLTEKEADRSLELIDILSEAGDANGFPRLVDVIGETEEMTVYSHEAGDSTDIDTTKDVMDGLLRMEGGTMTYDYLQNPETVQAAKIRSGDEQGWILSNISVEKLVSEMGGTVIQDSRFKIQDSNRDSRIGGVQRVCVVEVGGQKVTLVQMEGRSRIRILQKDADVIQANSSLLIRPVEGVSTQWVTVYRRVDDGGATRFVPVKTDSGYGVNGVEKIDQAALGRLKEGDSLRLEADLNDTYNQSLINDYKRASAGTDRRASAEAKDRLLRNMVIKAYHGNGAEAKFVSVVPTYVPGGTDGTGEERVDLRRREATPKRKLIALRTRTFNQLAERMERDGGNAPGVLRIENQDGRQTAVKVKRVMPGKPGLELRMENGSLQVARIAFSGNEPVTDTGYVLNGEVRLRGKTENVDMEMFLGRIIRGGRDGGKYAGKKVGVVVFERNGKRYAYPVGLKEIQDATDQAAADMLMLADDMIARPDSATDEAVAAINRFLTVRRIDRSRYSAPGPGEADFAEKMRGIREKLLEAAAYPDVTRWLDKSRSIKDILRNEALININLNGDAFHSPKVSVEYGDTDEIANPVVKEGAEESAGKRADADRVRETANKALDGKSLDANETALMVNEGAEALNKLFGEEGDVRDHEPQTSEIQELETVNERFNEELETLTAENANSKILHLGKPGAILQSAGIPDNPMELYGNKLFKKAKKHIYNPTDLKDLPKAANNPVAVFKGNREDSFTILTELNVNGNNVLVSIETNKKGVVDINFITSVYGKSGNKIIDWINSNGMLLYSDKEKTLNYLSALAKTTSATNNSELSNPASENLGAPAPIAGSASNSEFESAAKIVQNFENPKLSGEEKQSTGSNHPETREEKRRRRVRKGETQGAARIQEEVAERATPEEVERVNGQKYSFEVRDDNRVLDGNGNAGVSPDGTLRLNANVEVKRPLVLENGEEVARFVEGKPIRETGNGGQDESRSDESRKKEEAQAGEALSVYGTFTKVENVFEKYNPDGYNRELTPEEAETVRDILTYAKENGSDPVSMLERLNRMGYIHRGHFASLWHAEGGRAVFAEKVVNDLGVRDGEDGGDKGVEIAEAEKQTDTHPTEAQKEAGNYKKGHVSVQGFNISIEQPKGSVRSGVDESGKPWSVTMNNTYGYIRGTEGRDRDQIDVFLGENPESGKVFVVDQVNPGTGRFDEHKVMMGFDNIEQAREAYLSNYEEGWQGLGDITETAVEDFRAWANREGRRIKPFADYAEFTGKGWTEDQFDLYRRGVAIVHSLDTVTRDRMGVALKNGDFEEIAAIVEMADNREGFERAEKRFHGLSERNPVVWEKGEDTSPYDRAAKMYESLWRRQGGTVGEFNEALDDYERFLDEREKNGAGVRMQSVEDLEAVNGRFNEELQQQIDGTLPAGHTYKIGNPSDVLQSAGIPNLPIELQASRLSDKSMQESHPFELPEVSDLPKAIQTPLAVFDSATRDGSFVILTEIEHNGKNFVVAIQANRKKGSIEINDIRSIHYRKSNVHIANWINNNLTRRVDKQKMSEWFSKQQYNSAEVKGSFTRAAKIVQDFENPKLPAEKMQSSDEKMQSVPARAWRRLIDRLRRTGLARDVIADEGRMREYLEKRLGKERAERFMIFMMPADIQPQIQQEYNISERYNTKLSSSEEIEYQDWRSKLPENLQNEYDYDLRGLWKENGNAEPSENLHFPDKYKKPNHFTFSEESIYSKEQTEGGKWVEDNGKWKFYASYYNLTQHSREELEDYFDNYEKDSELILPPELKFMATPRGEVYGFVTPEGDVYLDPGKMNANTPIHEFGHLWNDFVKKDNPELWARGGELIKNSPYWERVNGNPAYAGLSEEAKVDEALAMAIGDRGETVIRESGIGAKLRAWLNEVWEWLGSKLGIRNLTAGQIENLTLEDFVSGAVADLLGGKFIGDLESSQKNGIFAENNNRVYDSQGRNRPSESARGNAVSDGSSQGQQQSGNEVLVGNAADELRSSIEAAGKELPGLSKQEVNDLEKRKTLEYAKENGLWIDDLYSLGRPFPGGGNENTLALDEKTGTVFKSNNLFNYGDSIQNLLNAVRIHNELFPETRYDLVGFTGIDNGATRTPYIEVILKQKHVPDAGQATPTEIAGFMQSLGFERVNGHTFTNGRYTVSDMHPRNVLKNAAGDIFVVDDIITANGAGEAVGNLENSEKNGIFAKENNYNGRKEGTETGLGHGRRMGESALRGLVGEQSQSSGILEAIAAGYGRGGDGTAAQTGQGGWQKERFLGSLEIAARSNGTWIDDIHSIAGKPIAKGQENEVYRSKDGKKVIKVNNLSLLDAEHGFDDFIDRLRSHNELFGKEIPYRITGFTENSLGEVSVVLEQPYVRAEREATQEEIDDYLESKGFRETTLPDGMPGWTNGEYEIWDAEPRNVLADRDDNLYFIDTVVNSRRRGAERERGQYVIQYASQPDYDFDVSGITEANAREMRAIKEAAVGNGTFMKAPNRKPTKLNERQWLQMRTEAFKGWFGDWENNPGNASKIVDENGEPLAVYHGGLNRFTEFRTQSQYISYSNPDTGQEEKFFWSTDGSLGEGAYFTSDKDFAMQYTGGGYGKMGDKGVLYEVFLNIRNPYEGNYNNEYKEKSDAEAAGFDGSQDTGNDEYVAFSPNQIKSATSNNGNFDEGSGDIRFQFIGEQGAANLDRAQEANTRMDNLNVARGMEAAFAEKKARIRRLRESVPIEIAGNEIAPGKDLREYRKNANQYGLDHLRDVYTNRDTGNEISVTKGSIKEVTSHDLSKEQLQSVAAIPQIIENGIYIETLENEDRKKHFDVDSYDYYVAGLKIGGTDYTVKAAIANSKSGERYYDHSLTRIEKGRLILEAHAIGNHGQKSNSLSGIKDTKLLSILQMNEEESARRIKMATGWERGADRKWRYETADIEVNENLIKTGTGDISSLPLEDVISNSDGLFSAYPQLKRIMVKVEEFDFGGAYWNEAKQEIVFNAKYFYANNKERNRGSIIHEIQHAIQDTEGFASGGNSERFGNVHNPDAHKKWSDTLNAIRYIKDFGFYKGSVYSHSLSDFAREQVNSVSRMKPENAIKKLQIQADEYMAKANVFDREAGYDKYRRAAGEVEARNASRRMDMTAAQRRATLVRETEDVAREDQIFIYDAMGERRSADIREIDPLRIPNGYDAVYVRSTNELMLPDRGRMRVLKPEGRRLREVMPEALIRETAEILEWEC